MWKNLDAMEVRIFVKSRINIKNQILCIYNNKIGFTCQIESFFHHFKIIEMTLKMVFVKVIDLQAE